MVDGSSRESLGAPILRHGETEFSYAIARGEKPSYKEFVSFMSGEIDPPIDEEATGQLIQNQIESGAINPSDYNIVICSPAARAMQTAELARKALGIENEIHPSKYLDELKMPMGSVTPEFYDQAKDIAEIRAQFFGAFLEGQKVDESSVDAFRRAERFLTYFRRIKGQTEAKPLFITHGIFSRILNLAINHEGESLNDDQVEELVRNEFFQTKPPSVFGGFELVNQKDGKTEIAGIF